MARVRTDGPRPKMYDEFGAKPRRSQFGSMVNCGVASDKQASANGLMVRDATEGSVSRQTPVVREDEKVPTHFQLGNCIGRKQFGAVSHAQLKHREGGLDYLHRSDVAHVKLSDFGLSLNLRAMEREIKDITGTLIELLMVRPPCGDIGNYR
ncbi:hypothetical protein EDB83DRAFT_167158 [Lactarius deliciosus]|nr:hypothetical protein EDB83DRAFT_167158 [Lactarius deliciosus]